MHEAADLNFAGDKLYCETVLGITICLAGSTIVMNSTEVKFIAAAEAGTYSLYVCLIIN